MREEKTDPNRRTYQCAAVFDSGYDKNFFVMVSAEFAITTKKCYTFEEVLACIQSSLHLQINMEHFKGCVFLTVYPIRGNFLLWSGVVIFEKYCHAYAYMKNPAVANTTTITNMGSIK